MASPWIMKGIHHALMQAFSATTVPGAVATGVTVATAIGIPSVLLGGAFYKTWELVTLGSAAKRGGFTFDEDKTPEVVNAPALQPGK